MRSNYWTCSKFADWLRGTTKGGAKTAEGWNDWEKQAKAAYPIRWWLAEEGLDYLQKIVYFIPDKLYGIKYYINNRWVTKTHALTAHPRDINPGTWHDVGGRFLPCLFNELQDFVEVELAWWHIAWADKAEKEKYKAPFWATGWFRWRTWRCPEAGLDNLSWQMNLTAKEDYGLNPSDKGYGEPTRQAVNAREIYDLYTWWTQAYRNRPDPYEASGWSAYCDASRAANGGRLSWDGNKEAPELKKMSNKASKLLRKIEADYEREDEQMMIRLIKVRHSLWT